MFRFGKQKGVIFQYDNARRHSLKEIQEKIRLSGQKVLPYSPCSQDLASKDFHLFQQRHEKKRKKGFQTFFEEKHKFS